MHISKVLEKAETVQKFSCEFEGEEFWFEAKARYITPELAQIFADTQTRPIKIAEGLAKVITKWSIYDGAISKEQYDTLPGSEKRNYTEAEVYDQSVVARVEYRKKFPPTVENLAKVPVEFLNLLVEQLSETWAGNAQRPQSSQNGSAQ